MTILTPAELEALHPHIPDDGGEWEAWMGALEREWKRSEKRRLCIAFGAGAVCGAALVVMAAVAWWVR